MKIIDFLKNVFSDSLQKENHQLVRKKYESFRKKISN